MPRGSERVLSGAALFTLTIDMSVFLTTTRASLRAAQPALRRGLHVENTPSTVRMVRC